MELHQAGTASHISAGLAGSAARPKMAHSVSPHMVFWPTDVAASGHGGVGYSGKTLDFRSSPNVAGDIRRGDARSGYGSPASPASAPITWWKQQVPQSPQLGSQQLFSYSWNQIQFNQTYSLGRTPMHPVSGPGPIPGNQNASFASNLPPLWPQPPSALPALAPPTALNRPAAQHQQARCTNEQMKATYMYLPPKSQPSGPAGVLQSGTNTNATSKQCSSGQSLPARGPIYRHYLHSTTSSSSKQQPQLSGVVSTGNANVGQLLPPVQRMPDGASQSQTAANGGWPLESEDQTPQSSTPNYSNPAKKRSANEFSGDGTNVMRNWKSNMTNTPSDSTPRSLLRALLKTQSNDGNVAEKPSSTHPSDSQARSTSRAVAVVPPLSQPDHEAIGTAAAAEHAGSHEDIDMKRPVGDDNQVKIIETFSMKPPAFHQNGSQQTAQMQTQVSPAAFGNSRDVIQTQLKPQAEPSAAVSRTASLPKDSAESPIQTYTWTLSLLQRLIVKITETQGYGKSEATSDLGVSQKLIKTFWENNHQNIKNFLLSSGYKKIMYQTFNYLQGTAASPDHVVLSEVKNLSMRPNSRIHVMAPDEVYQETPYRSSWLNLQEQLHDIDKEFGFPQCLRRVSQTVEGSGPTDSTTPHCDKAAAPAADQQGAIPGQTQPDASEPDNENQMSGFIESTQQPCGAMQDASPLQTPVAPPSSVEAPVEPESVDGDPHYSIKIQVLPPEEAKRLYEESNTVQSAQVQGQPAQQGKELPPAQAPPPQAKKQSGSVPAINEFCCTKRWLEVILGMDESSLSEKHKCATDWAAANPGNSGEEEHSFVIRSECKFILDLVEEEADEGVEHGWPEELLAHPEIMDISEDEDDLLKLNCYMAPRSDSESKPDVDQSDDSSVQVSEEDGHGDAGLVNSETGSDGGLQSAMFEDCQEAPLKPTCQSSAADTAPGKDAILQTGSPTASHANPTNGEIHPPTETCKKAAKVCDSSSATSAVHRKRPAAKATPSLSSPEAASPPHEKAAADSSGAPPSLKRQRRPSGAEVAGLDKVRGATLSLFGSHKGCAPPPRQHSAGGATPLSPPQTLTVTLNPELAPKRHSVKDLLHEKWRLSLPLPAWMPSKNPKHPKNQPPGSAKKSKGHAKKQQSKADGKSKHRAEKRKSQEVSGELPDSFSSQKRKAKADRSKGEPPWWSHCTKGLSRPRPLADEGTGERTQEPKKQHGPPSAAAPQSSVLFTEFQKKHRQKLRHRQKLKS